MAAAQECQEGLAQGDHPADRTAKQLDPMQSTSRWGTVPTEKHDWSQDLIGKATYLPAIILGFEVGLSNQ
jgi:hypothetical protein